MNAILVVPEQEVTPRTTIPCLPLVPMMDRPFIQHVVEALVSRGVTDIQVVLGPGADAVERFLGDGTRWGCSFSYYMTADPEQPAWIRHATADGKGPVVLARADYLPVLPAELSNHRPGVLFGTPSDWSGWAVVDASILAQASARSSAELVRYLASRRLEWMPVRKWVVLRSLSDVPGAQRMFLGREVPGALVAANEMLPGVWLARNVRLAPTSTLVPPVYVGENTVVGAGARLGPFAVVGPNCLLDRDCRVHDATVCADTYLGPGVELHAAIADGRSLLNPGRRSVATIDARLLDRVAPDLSLGSGLGRMLAAFAYIIGLPVVLGAALWLRLTRPGPVFWQRRFSCVPTTASNSSREVVSVTTLAPPRPDENETGWVIPATFRGLVLEFLPALACVARGGLRLVGLPPRNEELLREQAAVCPSLLRGSPGLVTEVALYGPEQMLPEDRVLVDAYQVLDSSTLANLKRLCRYLFRALTVWGRPSAGLPLKRAAAADTDRAADPEVVNRALL